ncbi:MAG TPA: hypothetical protein VMU95_01350 [Trebonia sp.]|nr:hypothetical protein [Trebonia sp.]
MVANSSPSGGRSQGWAGLPGALTSKYSASGKGGGTVIFNAAALAGTAATSGGVA